MSIELKTRLPVEYGHVELVQGVDLDKNAIDYLVFGALIYHSDDVGYDPTLRELIELLQGSVKRLMKPFYKHIDFDHGEVEESVKRLEGRKLIESYVKEGHEHKEERIRPLVPER